MTDSVYFACLYLKERPALRRYLTKLTGNQSVAEDLLQDTFLRVWEKKQNGGNLRDARAYLLRSARNLALNALTAQRHAPDLPAAQEMADATPSVVERMIAREELLTVMGAIAALPPRRREVFILSRVDELTYDHIAARLGISRNTVMVQIVRALADLRQALAIRDAA